MAHFLEENKTGLTASIVGLVVSLVIAFDPSFEEIRPLLTEIVTVIITAVMGIFWRKEHNRHHEAETMISKLLGDGTLTSSSELEGE